ncbi:50S ribosomal protein L2 [Candidatus Vidania fulgoroideorum]
MKNIFIYQLKKYKPTSPGSRGKVNIILKTKKINLKKLINIKKKTGGRNNLGRITTRHIGGGHKQKYIIIEFIKNKKNIGSIKSIQYDCNRNSFISCVLYTTGEKKYILHINGINIGDKIYNNYKDNFNLGNSMKLKYIPIGTKICQIEIIPNKGAKMARSAGTFAILISQGIKYSIIRLKSGLSKKINKQCRATIGEIGNPLFYLKKKGKAGTNRHLGKRPNVRGVAMNPIDHPHGGGEGKTSSGRHPVSFSGKLTKGKKTRKK